MISLIFTLLLFTISSLKILLPDLIRYMLCTMLLELASSMGPQLHPCFTITRGSVDL